MARDQVKTMASRVHGTLGHPEVKQELHTTFPLLGYKPHPLRLTRLTVTFLPYNVWSPAYLFEYTMVVNHGLLEEIGVL